MQSPHIGVHYAREYLKTILLGKVESVPVTQKVSTVSGPQAREARPLQVPYNDEADWPHLLRAPG